MSADFEMRFRLQQVGAYRMLCRSVSRSGRENVFFAMLMLFIAFYAFNPLGGKAPFLLLVVFAAYVGLALGELAVGLFKWVKPSAEGVLLDGVVLLLFAGWNLGLQAFVMANGGQLNSLFLILGVFMLMQAFGRFRQYNVLRKLFAERPSPELMRWLDDLVHEIRASDPHTDNLAIDLPTHPHLKAKLLGSTAFFVAMKGDMAFVASAFDFELMRESTEHGTGQRKALLRVFNDPYPEFQITDASWDNYQKWLAANVTHDTEME